MCINYCASTNIRAGVQRPLQPWDLQKHVLPVPRVWNQRTHGNKAATKRGHSVTWLLMWPKRVAAYKGCMYLNNSSLQLCSPSCLFPAESTGWAIRTAAWLPHLQPWAPIYTVKGLNLQLKSRNSSLVLPLSDSIRAGLPGEAEVLP